jgi:hypothetical protein
MYLVLYYVLLWGYSIKLWFNENKKSRLVHRCLCCVLCSRDAGTSQDNQVTETSTEKVQREKKRRNSENKTNSSQLDLRDFSLT